MNWLDIGKLVAPLAPTLGKVLGGLIPLPGGAIAGEIAGKLIAKQFGVDPTPEAVSAAIKGSPNEVAIAKLQAATEEAKAMWPAVAAMEAAREQTAQIQVAQVNETMRAELKVEGWFKTGWRPFIGWILGLEIAAIGATLVYAMILAVQTGKDTVLKTLIDSLPSICLYLAIPAACVGVAIWRRTDEKVAALHSAQSPAPTKK